MSFISENRKRQRSPDTCSRRRSPNGHSGDIEVNGNEATQKLLRQGQNDPKSNGTRGNFSKTQARINQIQEAEQMREWVSKEDEFMLQQAKKKARIRLQEGRAKNIDRFIVTLDIVETDRDLLEEDEEASGEKAEDPVSLIEKISIQELKDLAKEIASFVFLEQRKDIRRLWKALQVICDERLRRASGTDREDRPVESVSTDVHRLLIPKSPSELADLGRQVQQKLDSDEPIDVEYWEHLLQSISFFKARAELKRFYNSITSKPRSTQDVPTTTNSAARTPLLAGKEGSLANQPSEGESGRLNDGSSRSGEDFSQATQALYDREVSRGVQENEEIFTSEASLSAIPKPQWASKYRPRKPRYFNRVQMGYEWNKYNQTHYDHDNPPPKVVQGYKFNVFYPDLIDKTKAPTYRIERENGRKRGQSFAPAGEEDTCLIRFVSGPPYEDLAFRIVDKEWDFSAKRERGFRSSFDKGILQLHFSFKKVYYRK